MKKVINEISSSAKKSLLARVITGIVLAVLCIPCVILGSWYFFGLTIIVTIFASFEIVRVSNIKGLLKILTYFVTIIFALGIIYYCVFSKNIDIFRANGIDAFKDESILYSSFNDITLSIMLITLMCAVYFIISFSCESFSIAYVFYFVTMILVIAIGIQSILFLRFAPFTQFEKSLTEQGIFAPNVISKDEFKYAQSMFLLIYVVIGVIMNDMGAYFIGLLFGKHKMNERISPKKTWEGFVGGVVFSIVFSTIFALVCALLEKPILPIFDLPHLYYVILVSILIPLIADIGDFVFSSVKRTFGVKDYSQLLPGHGGVLDRIDSLLFAAALVSCLIIFISLILNGQPFNGRF